MLDIVYISEAWHTRVDAATAETAKCLEAYNCCIYSKCLECIAWILFHLLIMLYSTDVLP